MTFCNFWNVELPLLLSSLLCFIFGMFYYFKYTNLNKKQGDKSK